MAKILTETIIPALKSKLSDQSDKIFSATAAVAGGRITNINIAEAPFSPITYPYTIKFYIPSSTSSDTVGNTYADGRITVGGVNGSQLVADPISGIGQIPGSGTPLYYNTVYTLEARNVNGAIQYTIANVHNKIKAENIGFTTLFAEAPASTVTSIPLNTSTKIQSLIIPATGKWKISAQFDGYTSSDVPYTVEQTLKKNANIFVSFNSICPFNNATLIVYVQTFNTIDAEAGDEISYHIRALEHSIAHTIPDNCKLIAQRVG